MASSEELAARLRFIFAGAFRPETLVNSLNSPFNVCERIETNDLTVEDAITLMKQVYNDKSEVFVKQAYDIVGGQPYLLQFILSKLQFADEYEKQNAFDEAITLLRSGQNDHVEGVFGPIFADAELRKIVSSLTKNGWVNNEPANAAYRFLSILGIAKREGTHLVFRNKLYEEYARNSSQLMQ